MKALDTNVVIRFLVNDDKHQAATARKLLEDAEETGERLLLTTVVLLETIWVLRAVYELTRNEVVTAIDLLTQLSALELEDHDRVVELVRLGRATSLHLPDLLIGLTAAACGCETTLTFEKELEQSGLFERL